MVTKYRVKNTIYYLPRIYEGEYTQAEIDAFLRAKLEEGTVFVVNNDGTVHKEEDPRSQWIFDPNNPNFEKIT